MSIFDNIGNVEASGAASRYITDGKYRIKVSKFSQGVSKRGKGPFVAIEGEVLEVITGYADSNKVGETVSQVIMLNAGDIALRDVKAFVAAACNKPADHVTTDVCEKATANGGTVLAGAEIIADAQTITTKAGKAFTKVGWTAAA